MFLVTIINNEKESKLLEPNEAKRMFQLYKENGKEVMLFNRRHELVDSANLHP